MQACEEFAESVVYFCPALCNTFRNRGLPYIHVIRGVCVYFREYLLKYMSRMSPDESVDSESYDYDDSDNYGDDRDDIDSDNDSGRDENDGGSAAEATVRMTMNDCDRTEQQYATEISESSEIVL